MKSLVFFLALTFLSALSAPAQTTLQANSAAITSMRTALSSKKSQLSSAATSAALQIASNEFVKLMQQGVGHMAMKARLLSAGTTKDSAYKHMMMLETHVATYLSLNGNAVGNKQLLINNAQAFINNY